MTDGSGAPVQPKGVMPHSRLSLAKLVELRRRSRIDRARQLASNIETQAQILRATQIYNLEAAQVQLSNQLGTIGQGIPEVARVFHQTRLAKYDEDVAYLVRKQRDWRQLSRPASPPLPTQMRSVDSRPTPTVRPRHSNSARRGISQMPAGNSTLGAYVV